MNSFRRVPFEKPDARTVAGLKQVANKNGLDFARDIAPRLYNNPGEMFVNDRYQVIRELCGEVWHLSIKHLGVNEQSRWRDYQRIKNELVGDENEGIELYPAQSRLVDLADQYHLWVAADPKFRFDVGFGDPFRGNQQ